MKILGNKYVKDEFTRHKNANPEYLVGFYKGWTAYRDTLSSQLDDADTKIGAKLDAREFESLSDEQIGMWDLLMDIDWFSYSHLQILNLLWYS